VAIGTNPAAGTLSGTKTVSSVSGVATFSTLSIDKAGTGYTLSATSGTLTGATSNAFNVTPGAAAKLAGAFAKRRAQKVYWAIVAGFPKPGEGVLDLPLVKKGVGDREMVVPAEPKDPRAEPAETEFVTLARAGPRAAWMALWPHTGRTHQLRAHMLAMGHPILGDPKYRTEVSAALSEGLKLQLHARRLILPHPSRGMLALEAPISPEMRAGFERFGFDEHEADPDPFGKRR
jgi:23S rRNA pseudouridine955/2504/2580 synthase